MTADAWRTRLGTGLVACAFLGCVAFMVARPLSFIADDAYFYLEVARNLADGRGVTFNRIVSTNGFHPLWQGLLVPLAWATGGRPGLFVPSVAVLHGVLGMSALLVTARLLREENASRFACVALVPPASILGVLGTLGSESALNAFAIAGCLNLCFADDSRFSPAFGIVVGCALGGLVWVRLDNVFLAGLLCLWSARRRGWRTGVSAFVAASLVVAPYLLWNAMRFGHPVPVGGWLKSSFPAIGPFTGGLSSLHYLLLGLLVPPVAAVLFWDVSSRKRALVLVIASASGLQGLYHYLFQHHASWYWYTVLPGMAVGLGWALVAERVVERARSNLRIERCLQRALLVAVACASIGIIGVAWRDTFTSRPPWQLEVARRIEATLEEEAVVLAGEMPGAIQFWSNTRVLALDGLTSNVDAVRRRTREGLAYFERAGVDAILAESGGGRVRSTCVARTDSTCRTYKLRLVQWVKGGRRTLGSLEVSSSHRMFVHSSPNGRREIALWRWPD